MRTTKNSLHSPVSPIILQSAQTRGEGIMSSLLVKNALAIVTVDDKDRVLKNENILIEDGVITYIGK